MDLNAPLGMNPPPPRSKRRLVFVAGAAIMSVVLVALGVFLATADPHAGEPYAVAPIPTAAPKQSAQVAPATAADSIRTGSITGMLPLDGAHMENGVKVVRAAQPAGNRPSTGAGPLIIDVTKVLDNTRHSTDTASDTAGVRVKPMAATAPRIAIFISGMGLSPTATRTATEIMPAAVSFAFVPYGVAIGASVAAAKAKGHEVLLQVPMRSGPDAGPGPHALSPLEPPVAVAADLRWLMGRFDGYDGVANLLGGPVTSDAPVMTALLKTIGSHGLFYLDDGTSKRSLGLSLADGLGVPAARADVVLDATADPAVVRANLDTLAAIADRKGSAIGMASGLPDHLAAIARFAGALGSRGITLVPVSALAARDVAMAVKR